MQFKRENKTDVKVNIYGADYAMRMPSVREKQELIKTLESAKSQSELFDYQKKFIEGLGLPMDVIESMEFDHFDELSGAFISPKKK